MFVLGSYSSVHFWELTVPFQYYIGSRTYAFFSDRFHFWELPFQISTFWKFPFLRGSTSDFKLSETFHFWELIFPFLRWPFWDFSFLKVAFFHFWGGHSQRFHFWEFPLQISHFLTESFHFWEFTFLRVYIAESFHFNPGCNGMTCGHYRGSILVNFEGKLRPWVIAFCSPERF